MNKEEESGNQKSVKYFGDLGNKVYHENKTKKLNHKGFMF